MADIIVRPSMKFVKAGYILTVVVIAAGVILTYKYEPMDWPGWVSWLWLVLLLWPMKRHIQRRSITLTISGDKLRYETGMASRSCRIIQLPKVQDVRVIQSVGQRLLGVGDISIETAGENSRLLVQNLDRPRQLAEQITDASSHAPSAGGLQ